MREYSFGVQHDPERVFLSRRIKLVHCDLPW